MENMLGWDQNLHLPSKIIVTRQRTCPNFEKQCFTSSPNNVLLLHNTPVPIWLYFKKASSQYLEAKQFQVQSSQS